MNPKRYLGCIFALPHSFGGNVVVVPAGTEDFGKVSTNYVDYHQHQVLVWKIANQSDISKSHQVLIDGHL